MQDIDYFKVKIIADILGYISGFLAGYFSYKFIFNKDKIFIPFRNLEEKIFYYLAILGGGMFFGILVSTNIIYGPKIESLNKVKKRFLGSKIYIL